MFCWILLFLKVAGTHIETESCSIENEEIYEEIFSHYFEPELCGFSKLQSILPIGK